MRGAVLYAPGDVRVEQRAGPVIISPTDAIIRIAATCVCGSDLWDYCLAGYQTSCTHREFINGCQAELVRVPLADGTLVATPGQPEPDLIPSLLALSDVMGTGGVGADSVLECVGTSESLRQSLRSARPGGNVGFVGVPHAADIPAAELFYSHVALRGGPAPVRRFLPELIDRAWDRQISPGQVFDLALPLGQAAEAYRAMDERRAVKSLLRP